MKLCDRLGVREFVGLDVHSEMLERAERESPSTNYLTAWNKFNRADLHGVIALDHYLLDDHALARKHAAACLKATEEFILGDWREKLTTPEGKHDPAWWRKRMVWMEVFAVGLLWGPHWAIGIS